MTGKTGVLHRFCRVECGIVSGSGDMLVIWLSQWWSYLLKTMTTVLLKLYSEAQFYKRSSRLLAAMTPNRSDFSLGQIKMNKKKLVKLKKRRFQKGFGPILKQVLLCHRRLYRRTSLCNLWSTLILRESSLIMYGFEHRKSQIRQRQRHSAQCLI